MQSPPARLLHSTRLTPHEEILLDLPIQGPEPPRIPGYRIEDVLARGGMGMIYKARQLALDRLVALKMVVAGNHTSVEDIHRFLSEARALAAVTHPGLIQIYDFGTHQGLPFFAMEFCPGGSLAARLDGTPWPATAAAMLVAQLADAIDVVHQRGIIHRDLKPGNVLFDERGQPRISDFGIAKFLQAQTDLTETGLLVGTAQYMAPEQADPHRGHLTPASDVYSLGVILYELLTGGPPFNAGNQLAILHQVLGMEPVPPRRLHPDISRDLETICLTCLAKDSHKRYPTAAALRDDLRRYLSGAPIEARPPTTLQRLGRSIRRHPALSGMVGLATGMLGLLLGVMVQSNLDLQREYTRAQTHQQIAEQEHHVIRQARAKLESAQAATEAARHAAELAVIDSQTIAGLASDARGDPAEAVLWFSHAAARARCDPRRECYQRLRLQNWLKRLSQPVAAFLGQDQPIIELAFHPDSRHLLSTTSSSLPGQQQSTIWDLSSQKAVPWPEGLDQAPYQAFSPDGRWLAQGREGGPRQGEFVVLDFASGRRLLHRQIPCGPRILAFHPNGNDLLTGSHGISVWDLRDSDRAPRLRLNDRSVQYAAFSPGGQFVLVWARSGDILVLSFPELQTIHEFPCRLPYDRRCLPQFLDEQTLVALETRDQLAWWELATGKKSRTTQLRHAGQPQPIQAIRKHPSQPWLGLATQHGVQVVHTQTGQPLGPRLQPDQPVHDLAFGRDNHLLTVGGSHQPCVWKLPEGRQVWQGLGHVGSAVRVVADASGKMFAVGWDNGLIRCWLPKPIRETVAGIRPTIPLPLPKGARSAVVLSPDGQRLAFAGQSQQPSHLRQTQVFAIADGQPVGPVLPLQGWLCSAAFSPDGQSLATLEVLAEGKPSFSQASGRLRIWDWQAGVERVVARKLPNATARLAYHPSGKQLTLAFANGAVWGLDPLTGTVLVRQPPHTQAMVSPANTCWSADGKTLLVHYANQTIAAYQGLALEPVRPSPLAAVSAVCSQLSPDDTTVAVVEVEKRITLYDRSSGAIVGQLPHPAPITALHFSPDTDALLTVCKDDTVRIWTWRESQQIRTCIRGPAGMSDAYWLHAGETILTLDRQGQAQLWETETGLPLSPPFPIAKTGGRLSPTGNPQRLLLSDAASDLALLRSGPASQDDQPIATEDLPALGEMIAGQRLHRPLEPVPLSSAEWYATWQYLRKRYPDYMAVPLP